MVFFNSPLLLGKLLVAELLARPEFSHVWVALVCFYKQNFPGMWICSQLSLLTLHQYVWEALTSAAPKGRMRTLTGHPPGVLYQIKPSKPLANPPNVTQHPHRPLVQLNLPVGEVWHLLEGVDGDEHRPDVGLSGRLRSVCPFPCPFLCPAVPSCPDCCVGR